MRLREVRGPLDMVYPVGSIYMNITEANPATLFGGTWERLEDTFLLAAGQAYAGGSSGGSANHKHTTGGCTLTVDQIPGHTHSVGAHAHGLNSHTHAYAKPNTPTGGTAINVAQMASHNHGTDLGCLSYSSSNGSKHTTNWSGQWSGNLSTSNNGSGSAQSHTIGTTSTNSGGPSTANTANSTAFDSGSRGGFLALSWRHGRVVEHAAVPGGLRLEARRVA